MTKTTKNLGDFGEAEAVLYLSSKGYEILERNFRCRIGEIDIITKEGETFVFVEVKTKSNLNFGLPEEMVNNKKQQKIIKIAQFWLKENEKENTDWRIDVLAIISEGGVNNFKLIKNAVEGY